jgi:hypothetical protein
MPFIPLLFGGLVMLASAIPTWAHGPWPYECCSNRDCDEVDAKSIREDGDQIHITIKPGTHPMWPADGRGDFKATAPRAALRKPVTGEWGICISPSGSLLCVFPPLSGV